MKKAHKKQFNKFRRKHRSTVRSTSDRMRLSVYRSLTSMYAQVIDDSKGVTLAAAKDNDLTDADKKGKTKVEIAAAVGALLAKKAQEKGIKKVVFGKGPFKYSGRVKAFGDAAREGGLEF